MGGASWPWIVRGIVSIAFGVLVLLLPAAAIATLVIAYGAYAIIDGAMLFGAAARERDGRAWLVVRGLLGVAAGVIAFAWPGITAFWLYVLIGAWSLAAGVMELVGAFAMRKTLPGMGVLALTGAVMLGFGIVLLAVPRIGIAALLGLVSAYGIVHGLTLLGVATRINEMFRPAHAHT